MPRTEYPTLSPFGQKFPMLYSNLIAPGSIPRSLLRTFNFEIWKLKCLGACPEDLYYKRPRRGRY